MTEAGAPALGGPGDELFDPYSSDFRRDPYPAYARSREQDPCTALRREGGCCPRSRDLAGVVDVVTSPDVLARGAQAAANFVDLIGNGMLALFRNPAETRGLHEDPGLGTWCETTPA